MISRLHSTPPVRSRELVLEHVLSGLSHPEIAVEMHLSIHTVGHLVQTLLREYGVKTTLELATTVLNERNRDLGKEAQDLRDTLHVIGRRSSDRREPRYG